MEHSPLKSNAHGILNMIDNEMCLFSKKKTSECMYILGSFTKDKPQLKCPSTGESIIKMWQIHMEEC